MSNYKGFTSVEMRMPKRSYFDLTHNKKITARAGNLIPSLWCEAIPGDKFHGSSKLLVRVNPLLAPIYDDIYAYVHFFFTPYRPVWEDWEEFITGGRLGVGVDPVDAPITPRFNLQDLYDDTSEYLLTSKHSLWDYFGCGLVDELTGWDDVEIDVLLFACYQWIWYEYYRDRNFISDDVLEFPIQSGVMSSADAVKMLTLRKRDYLKEYFTSALPTTQRGVEVLMPLEGSGTVTYLDRSDLIKEAGGVAAAGAPSIDAVGGGTPAAWFEDSANDPLRVENIDEVLLTASSVSINDFRVAYALQVWAERNEIAGSRYFESNRAHFGVKSPDSRMQRPEYIGGGRVKVQFSEVVTTAYSQNGNEQTIPAANLTGHGVAYGTTNDFRYYAVEHGAIIGIMSVMFPPSYHQGLPRAFFARRSFLDYPWPTFAKLGEQEVAKVELYFDQTNATPDEEGKYTRFGYQSRYADWKSIPDTNHGSFHDTYKYWTLVREFADSPELGAQFVALDQTVQDRIFAVQGQNDNFLIYCHNEMGVTRCLPYFGVPNTLGFS